MTAFTPDLPALRLLGARCLIGGDLVEAGFAVQDGLLEIPGEVRADLRMGRARDVRLDGYYLLPGIVDLHGDAFERHIAPRPSAPFDQRLGLDSVDRELVAHGVTTAFLAQSWSWEGGRRSPDYALALMALLAGYRPEARADLRLQIRFETHIDAPVAPLLAAMERYGVGYLVFNNHLPEALAMCERDPQRLAAWARESARAPAEHMQIVRQALAGAGAVPARMAQIAAWLEARGLPFGSHDDATQEDRQSYARLGARIAEFPTTRKAALTARAMGDPVLMGAPNVVRGGSQSGNIAAVDLIADDLCDALVSDYYYPALAGAALRLAHEDYMSFPAAWAMISERPAQIIGLQDRGRLAPGQRADLVLMHAASGRIEGTLVAGRPVYLSGDLALRFTGALTM